MERREIAEKVAAEWNRRMRNAHWLVTQPLWSKEELQAVAKIAERVRSGQISENAAAKEIRKEFPWRRQMSTRLKIRKALGKWHRSSGKKSNSKTRTAETPAKQS